MDYFRRARAEKGGVCDGLCWHERTMENDDAAERGARCARACVCVSLARRARDAVSAVTYCPLSGNRECLSLLAHGEKAISRGESLSSSRLGGEESLANFPSDSSDTFSRFSIAILPGVN